MSDVITGNTQLGATKQDLIASLVQRELAAQTLFLPTVTDVSMYAVKGSQSIAFPKTGTFTVENRASGVPGTKQALSYTKDVMNLDQRAYVSWLIDSNDAYQSNVAVAQENIRRAASAHARYVDSTILTALEAIAFNTPASSIATPVNITDAIILNMRKQLLTNFADRQNISFAISVDQEAVMLLIDKFVRYDALGVSNIPDGAIGKIYGMPVFVSNNLELGQALMYDKAALAVGFQKAPNYASQPHIEYGTTAVLEAVDQLFGVKGMQLGGLGVTSSQSPLCVKLKG